MSKTPKDVPCPTCKAQPGSPCRRPSGHTVPFGDYHAARRDIAWSMEEIARQDSPEGQRIIAEERARAEGRLF